MKKIIFLSFFILANNIYSQNYLPEKDFSIIKYFFDSPFVDNIPIPRFIYKNYDEIFEHLGIPMGENEFNFIGRIAREFIYDEYNVCTLYSDYREQIFVFLVWITVQEDRIYNYDINRNNTRSEIENIFGTPDYVSRISENIVEIDYYTEKITMEELRFQFNNNRLESILLWCWD